MRSSGNTPWFSYLLVVALAVAAFWAGTAWRSADSTRQNSESNEPADIATDSALLSSVRQPAMPPNLTEEEKATIKLFESSKPSVCFITTSVLRQDWYRNVYEVPSGSGSGFIWDEEGHIITNFHVIQGARKATVTLADGSNWDARLIGYAPEKDLAVLKIDAPARLLRPLKVGTSADLRVGQNVFAIGNPFGLDYTLTKGIVSALDREIESRANIPIRGVIQTDAAINPGNSGGPLLDSGGRLIGVNTAIYSPSGASAGIGFSIPVDEVRWVVPDLIRYGEIKRPSLGIEPASDRQASRLGIEGVLVINTLPNSGARKAGLRPTRRDQTGHILLGDIIVGIGEEKITSLAELRLSLEKYKPGDEVQVTFLRDGQRSSVLLRLDAPK